MEFDDVDFRIEVAKQTNPWDVCVRVNGLGPELAQEVQALVAAIFERQGSTGTGAGAATQRQPGPPREDVQAPLRPVDVSVLGTFADRAQREDLEGDIRDTVVTAMLQARDEDGGGSVCVCASTTPGDEIVVVFGGSVPWKAGGVWVDPPTGGNTWLFPGVRLDSAPFNFADLRVENGALRDPPVGPDQVLVGLANSTAWAKEIWAFNACSGRLSSVYQEGTNGTPRTMLLSQGFCREGADTIVFRKPGFFGVWHDVGHWPDASFWSAFGGTVATFTWTVD